MMSDGGLAVFRDSLELFVPLKLLCSTFKNEVFEKTKKKRHSALSAEGTEAALPSEK